jgi:organic hydroperoxide reductase OsmC/OhrA
MIGTHNYALDLEWTGNLGTGTASYRGYDRSHVLRAATKPDLLGSADKSFRGDPTRWNPEELLLAALSSCHMLSYLHQAAANGVVVTAYTDTPVGEMVEDGEGGGSFRSVLLQPVVTVADPAMTETAGQLHGPAHDKCFIASSVNFPVRHRDTVLVDPVQPGGG